LRNRDSGRLNGFCQPKLNTQLEGSSISMETIKAFGQQSRSFKKRSEAAAHYPNETLEWHKAAFIQ
jgi:hypothetical protein